MLVIKRTTGQPVTFRKDAYIRIGSYTKPIRDYPTQEAQLWDKLRLTNFETQAAKSEIKKGDIFSFLDFSEYFELQNITVPSNQDGILHYALEDKIVVKQDNGLYSITNLGALLFAKRIEDFPSVSRKAIRLIQYEDDTKLRILKEYSGHKGYAVGFEGLMQYLKGEHLTNQSLRERFGIEEKNKAIISRLIADAVSKNLIKVFDETTAPRYKSYVPIWA